MASRTSSTSVDRRLLLDDPLDLAELVHQPGLGVQPAGGVDQDDVDAVVDAGLHRLERDAGRVGALRPRAPSARRPARPTSAAARRRRRGRCRPHRGATVRPSATSTRASLPIVVVLPVPLTPTTRTTAGAPAGLPAVEATGRHRGSTSASSSSRSIARTASGSATPSTLTRVRSRSTSSARRRHARGRRRSRVSSTSSQVASSRVVARQQREQPEPQRRLGAGEPPAQASQPSGGGVRSVQPRDLDRSPRLEVVRQQDRRGRSRTPRRRVRRRRAQGTALPRRDQADEHQEHNGHEQDDQQDGIHAVSLPSGEPHPARPC